MQPFYAKPPRIAADQPRTLALRIAKYRCDRRALGVTKEVVNGNAMNELDFLKWVRERPGPDERKVPVGPGDDMAVVRFDRNRLLLATDQVLDGVHVDVARVGYQASGRKAMARNLSDIAAMAALPVAAVASAALPRGATDEDARAIHRGIATLAEEFECPLVGGDLGAWDGPLAISVTVAACPAGATGGIRPVLRSGAKPGNALCVTGALGGAWTTDRHLTFTPRVREAILLALRHKIRAMIDISDGLATDLHRLLEAGGVGAELHADAIPIHPDAARSGVSGLDAALADGEDHELLFAVPGRSCGKLLADDKLHLPITRIGTVTADRGVRLLYPDGRREPLPKLGWEHRT